MEILSSSDGSVVRPPGLDPRGKAAIVATNSDAADDSKATEASSGDDSLKRKIELEKMVLAKRLMIEDEDD